MSGEDDTPDSGRIRDVVQRMLDERDAASWRSRPAPMANTPPSSSMRQSSAALIVEKLEKFDSLMPLNEEQVGILRRADESLQRSETEREKRSAADKRWRRLRFYVLATQAILTILLQIILALLSAFHH